MSITDVQRPAPSATGRAPQIPVAKTKPCSCGHVRAAHEHYRRGTDCALCGCGRYRGRRWFGLG